MKKITITIVFSAILLQKSGISQAQEPCDASSSKEEIPDIFLSSIEASVYNVHISDFERDIDVGNKQPEYQTNISSIISSYNERRDTDNIVQLFNNNLDLLVDRMPHYSIRDTLKRRNSYYCQQSNRMLQIKVLHDNNKFAGFVTYFTRNNNVGHILFLAVDAACRRKGFGRLLMHHAMIDLKIQGAEGIDIVTGSTNKQALALYQSEGFVITKRDDHNIYLLYGGSHPHRQ